MEDSIVESGGRGNGKYNPVSALFPYTLFLEQGGRRRMVDRRRILAYSQGRKVWAVDIITVQNKQDSPSLNWILGLISPRVLCYGELHDEDVVARQAAAASATSNPGEVCWSVAEELLCIVFIDSLRPPALPKFFRRLEGAGELKRVLLGVDGEATATLTRTPLMLIRFCQPTPAGASRIPLDLHVTPLAARSPLLFCLSPSYASPSGIVSRYKFTSM